ncbi:MFS transporter [Corynebacterium sp. 13CS0277]|uniref:MFS transporter n=1 Tax=Corynebacterium sp. 13CS0277 TaxID=2071994 RepID=UPI000D02DF27|nr:MFS transporter [Corynebacterium sp. 13CS0277]PRQ12579.1 MFS transporter [Corynebacterium sp. 13CS0277]
MSATSIYRAPLWPTTAGILVAVIATAFDQTAVTAVMPTITSALGGTSAYSLTFVLPFAASVFGMVGAGVVTDRYGARLSMLAGCLVLLAGLGLAIIAPTMAVFVASRVIQGLGGGALIVAIYSVIGVAYPAALRPKVFAAFAGAWVVPSLIGPGVAGLIAQATSWHGVFVLVAATLLLALVLLARVLRTLPRPKRAASGAAGRSTRGALLAATLVSLSVAVMNFSSQVDLRWAAPLFLGGAAATVWASRPLVPRGNALMWTRAFADMFFAAEIYLPLLLSQSYRLGPTLTGLGLTVSGVTWFAGSTAQARIGARVPLRTVVLASYGMMTAGMALLMVAAAMEVHWAVAVAGWGISAAGMGFLYPRLSSDALERAGADATGFHGSALQVMGIIGTTTMVSLAAIIQTSGARFFPDYKFTVLFAVIAASALPMFAYWGRPAARNY